MSKVNVSINTDDKTCAVDVDGVSVDNIAEFSCYRDDYDEDGKYYFRFATKEKNGKLMKHTYYAGASSKKAQAALNDGLAQKSKKIPGCVEMVNDINIDYMAEYLKPGNS